MIFHDNIFINSLNMYKNIICILYIHIWKNKHNLEMLAKFKSQNYKEL